MDSRGEHSNWVELLETMYEEQMHSTDPDTDSKGEVTAEMIIGGFRMEKIQEQTELSAMDLDTSVKFLDGAGLIDATHGSDDELVNIGLTKEGLQLAHQIKTERQRETMNSHLLTLTAVLTVLTIGLLLIEIIRMGVL